MINRGNWQLVEEYLTYRQEVDMVSPKTISLEKTWLRYLLEWADDRSFGRITNKRPTYPEYLLISRKDKKPFAREYLRKLISCARRFFEWLRIHQTGFDHKISLVYLETLKAPRLPESIKEHEFVTLEEIRAMAKAPVYSLRDERIRAATVFWFLSGIRIGAFVTLPIISINLSDLSVKQWPDLGVQTKNGKHATTYLVNIPDLVEVVSNWDKLVRGHLPDNFPWFAALSPETGLLDSTIKDIGNHRDSRARKDLQIWLDRVGLPYHSPHKFRHGTAVYSLKRSKDIHELKSVSQNLMHKNLSTTDGIYGGLSNQDVGETIRNLGGEAATGNISQNELIGQMENLLAQLKQNTHS